VRSLSRASCIVGVVVAAAAVSAAGCGSPDRAVPASADAVPTQSPNTASRLSYGTITSTVKKNQTTQLDLLDLFGGPNISSTDADGLETWVYERSASQTDSAASSDARNLNAFFGGGGNIGGATIGGGVAGGSRSTDDRARTSTSVRNLTVIIKFNPDKTVRDYSVRQSTF
jgi:hypothetical protein